MLKEMEKIKIEKVLNNAKQKILAKGLDFKCQADEVIEYLAYLKILNLQCYNVTNKYTPGYSEVIRGV